MAIDEKKLIEEVRQWYWDKGLQKVDEEWADLWIDMFIRTIKKQPKISLENKTSDWISVEEALPNEDGNYLVSGVWGSGKKTVGDCEFSVSDGYFDVCWNFNVLAWMPLPKPYKSEE